MRCHRKPHQGVSPEVAGLPSSRRPSNIQAAPAHHPCWGRGGSAWCGLPPWASVLWRSWLGRSLLSPPIWLDGGSPTHVLQGLTSPVSPSDRHPGALSLKSMKSIESMKEHQDACQNGTLEKSALAEHAWENHHPIKWEETTVIDQARTSKELMLKEAIHIRLNHPSLNRDGGLELPGCWMAALRKAIPQLPVTPLDVASGDSAWWDARL